MAIEFNREAYNKVFNDLDSTATIVALKVRSLTKQTFTKKIRLTGRRIKSIQAGYVLKPVMQDANLIIGETNDYLRCRH